MADIKPFRGVRPVVALAAEVASPPYDVLNSAEAREMAAGRPNIFLHVNKPEIDLPPELDVHDERVYLKGSENLRQMINRGTIVQDEQPCFYVYRQVMGSHSQVGLVACASVAEYENGLIKKHELTRPDKEDDRVKHIDYQNAQVGPVFLTYPAVKAVDKLIADIVRQAPVYDFVADDGIAHTFWVVSDPLQNRKIDAAFQKVPALYVADGHHRSAAATRIKQMRQSANLRHRGDESYNYFLSVIFPHNQMQILDYNRVVVDLNGLSNDEFLEKVAASFAVETLPAGERCKPERSHVLGMYLGGRWRRLTALPDSYDEGDPVKRLDVSILQENLLSPVLGITNPRKDQRIDFVGGIRGLDALAQRVDSGEWAVAFALHPTSIEELMAIADAGQIMPPKSTWFEPKLRTGLVIHLLD